MIKKIIKTNTQLYQEIFLILEKIQNKFDVDFNCYEGKYNKNLASDGLIASIKNNTSSHFYLKNVSPLNNTVNIEKEIEDIGLLLRVNPTSFFDNSLNKFNHVVDIKFPYFCNEKFNVMAYNNLIIKLDDKNKIILEKKGEINYQLIFNKNSKIIEIKLDRNFNYSVLMEDLIIFYNKLDETKNFYERILFQSKNPVNSQDISKFNTQDYTQNLFFNFREIEKKLELDTNYIDNLTKHNNTNKDLLLLCFLSSFSIYHKDYISAFTKYKVNIEYKDIVSFFEKYENNFNSIKINSKKIFEIKNFVLNQLQNEDSSSILYNYLLYQKFDNKLSIKEDNKISKVKI